MRRWVLWLSAAAILVTVLGSMVFGILLKDVARSHLLRKLPLGEKSRLNRQIRVVPRGAPNRQRHTVTGVGVAAGRDPLGQCRSCPTAGKDEAPPA